MPFAGVQGQQHRLPAQTVSGAGSAACARQAVAPVGRRSRRQTRRHRKDDLRAQRDLTNDTRAVQGQDHTRRHRLHSLFLYILRKGIAHYPLGRNLRRRQDFWRPTKACCPRTGSSRANRQFIVSRSAVKDIAVWFGSRLALNLTLDTPERIIISKARVPEFKRWLVDTSGSR